MATKLKRYDNLFSRCVRAAAYWKCARCQRSCPVGPVHGVSGIMHCSHIFSRRHMATRWHPDNALCLCPACHQHLEEAPDEHRAFARQLLGDTRFEALMQLVNSPYKWSPAELAEMHAHYKTELARLTRLGAPDELIGYQ